MADLNKGKKQQLPSFCAVGLWEWIHRGIGLLVMCWTFLMLAVFPLYAPEKYQGLGDYKFSFFLKASSILLIPGIVLAVVYGLGMLGQRKCEKIKVNVTGISVVDIGVFFYLTANMISFLLSDFKTGAWEGVEGWNMGLRTQLLMTAAYVLISRFFPLFRKNADGRTKKEGWLNGIFLVGAFIGSALAFVLGILHRFDVDPLGMYTGIDSSYKIWFLSTLGQATWYSSYICTVLPVGICIFCFSGCKEWRTDDRKGGSTGLRVISGLYCVLGFMTLVTQNSDSAFAALGLMFLGLFLVCCYSPKWMERFLETIILCAASFLAVGFWQWAFAERVIPLGSLSLMFSQGSISWIMLLAGSVLYLLLFYAGKGERRRKKLEQIWITCRGKIQAGIIILIPAAAAVLVWVIARNTARAANGGSDLTGGSYLLFNNSWGSNRGFTWRMSARIFADMPIMNKLIGAGPDCFYSYSYSIPEFAQQLHDFWKPDILTNAHNEFLNLLICVGILGLTSFLIMLVGGIWRFYRAGKKNPYVLMGVLTICSYMAHNFFCYQQVCCTPFLFLILGLAERLARNNTENQMEGYL